MDENSLCLSVSCACVIDANSPPEQLEQEFHAWLQGSPPSYDGEKGDMDEPSSATATTATTTAPAVKEDLRKQKKRGTNLYGRQYCPGRPLSMDERMQIINYHMSGMKVNAISKSLCISHGCVSKIITRYRQTGVLSPVSSPEHRRARRRHKSTPETGAAAAALPPSPPGITAAAAAASAASAAAAVVAAASSSSSAVVPTTSAPPPLPNNLHSLAFMPQSPPLTAPPALCPLGLLDSTSLCASALPPHPHQHHHPLSGMSSLPTLPSAFTFYAAADAAAVSAATSAPSFHTLTPLYSTATQQAPMAAAAAAAAGLPLQYTYSYLYDQ